MIKIFVGMPSGTGYPHPDAILNVFNQKLPKGYEIVFDMRGCPQRMPIHIARNKILEEFIKSECDYLLFCDDDNPMLLDVLEKLLESKKDIVSAIVPLRMYDKDGQALNIFYKDMNGSIKNYTKIPKRDNPLLEIANCGTGCVLLSKRVCLDMWKKYRNRAFWFTTKEIVYNKELDIAEDYNGQDKEEGRENRYISVDGVIQKNIADVSEDLNFFNRAKAMGYKIYARLDTECYHYNGMPSKRILKN